MARQNIDDEFWLDATNLADTKGIKLDVLVGNALRFQRYAQEMYKLGKPITREKFDALGFMPELIPVFATEQDGIITCVGADEYFSWLQEKSECGGRGGRRSAKRPRDEKGRLLPKQAEIAPETQAESKQSPSNIQATSKQHPSRVQATSKQTPSNDDFLSKQIQANPSKLQASPSSSSSPSNKNTGAKSRVEGVNEVIAVYCAGLKAKYHFSPDVRGKDAGLLKSLVRDVGKAKAIALVEAYLAMDDGWFKTKRHDLPTLTANLNRVNEFLATGVVEFKQNAEPVNLFARVAKD